VIGMYEPMIVLVEGKALLTSRAASDGTVPPDAHRYHETCFALIEGGGPTGTV
jgi:hypothetical protein